MSSTVLPCCPETPAPASVVVSTILPPPLFSRSDIGMVPSTERAATPSSAAIVREQCGTRSRRSGIFQFYAPDRTSEPPHQRRPPDAIVKRGLSLAEERHAVKNKFL